MTVTSGSAWGNKVTRTLRPDATILVPDIVAIP
jgi:hypothetical protein